MSATNGAVTAADRAALLQEGIVVLETEGTGGSLRLGVAGVDEERVRETVARRFGDDAEVDWLGELLPAAPNRFAV